MKLSKWNSLKIMYADIFKTKIVSGSKFAYRGARTLNYLSFKFLSLLPLTKYINRALFSGKKIIIKNSIGTFEVYPDNETMNLTSPFFEYHFDSWIDNSKKRLFIDVGANVGLYTLKAISAGYKRIIAFEPNPDTYKLLLRNMSLNKAKQVIAEDVGLGFRRETKSFYAEPTDIGSSRYVDRSELKNTASDGKILHLKLLPFDDYLRTHKLSPKDISFIKIDVEGAEYEVLRGMRNTLARINPGTRMMIEIWSKNNKKNLSMKILKENKMHLVRSSGDNYLFEKG